MTSRDAPDTRAAQALTGTFRMVRRHVFTQEAVVKTGTTTTTIPSTTTTTTTPTTTTTHGGPRQLQQHNRQQQLPDTTTIHGGRQLLQPHNLQPQPNPTATHGAEETQVHISLTCMKRHDIQCYVYFLLFFSDTQVDGVKMNCVA